MGLCAKLRLTCIGAIGGLRGAVEDFTGSIGKNSVVCSGQILSRNRANETTSRARCRSARVNITDNCSEPRSDENSNLTISRVSYKYDYPRLIEFSGLMNQYTSLETFIELCQRVDVQGIDTSKVSERCHAYPYIRQRVEPPFPPAIGILSPNCIDRRRRAARKHAAT